MSLGLGQRIQMILDRKEMTQKEFAQALNIAQTTLNGYIKERREPDYATLKAMARYLEVSIDYLMGMDAGDTGRLSLSDEEKELLKRYRALKQEQQELLQAQAALMRAQNARKGEEACTTISKNGGGIRKAN